MVELKQRYAPIWITENITQLSI